MCELSLFLASPYLFCSSFDLLQVLSHQQTGTLLYIGQTSDILHYQSLKMEVESCIPPGFRFHPTEEELVGYYLARKVNSKTIDLEIITDIDLYRIEPWDLQGRCKVGNGEQSEWYFFSHKDKKYPTGTRTNRATAAGFWKATGRDKAVLSKDKLIGMRKTLVFYRGRAPNGRKTDWVIHEYRLQTSEHAPPQEEGWVVCRAFKKQSPSSERHNFRYCNSVAYGLQDHGHFVSQAPGLDASNCLSKAMNHHNPQTIWEQIRNPSLILESSPEHEQLCSSPLPTSLIPTDTFNLPGALATDEANDWKILDDLLQSQLHETVPCIVNSSQPLMSYLPYEAFLDTH